GLLLERAGHVQARVPAVDRVGENLLSGEVLDVGCRRYSHQIAHSPSPRSTRYGSRRFQSMKWTRFSRLNSTGSDRSCAASSNGSVPTRSTNALNASPSLRSLSYMRIQRSTASGTR